MGEARLTTVEAALPRPAARRRVPTWAFAVLAGAVILAVGARFAAPGTRDGGSTGSTQPLERRIDMNGNGALFSDATLTVPAGREVRVTFVNRSRAVPHNWVLADGAQAIGQQVAAAGAEAGRTNEYLDPGSTSILAATPLVAPRGSVTITFTAPIEPGRYQFLCTVPGHYQSGMFGTLIVT